MAKGASRGGGICGWGTMPSLGSRLRCGGRTTLLCCSGAQCTAAQERVLDGVLASLHYLDILARVLGPLLLVVAAAIISLMTVTYFDTIAPRLGLTPRDPSFWALTLPGLWVVCNLVVNYVVCVLTPPGRPREGVLDSTDAAVAASSGHFDSDEDEEGATSKQPAALLGSSAGGAGSNSGSGRRSNGDSHSGWCRKCAAPKPPRSHHCSVCKACVLKMDHHCPVSAVASRQLTSELLYLQTTGRELRPAHLLFWGDHFRLVEATLLLRGLLLRSGVGYYP